MDASTVFMTVSLTMLANSTVLAIIYRELPATLRAAASYWQLGTLMVAVGCAFFAFGAPLPRTLMLTGSNGMFVFALTAYHTALLKFDAIRPKAWQVLPAIVTTVCVFWFSAFIPDFRSRLIVVSVVWLWLMVSCVLLLIRSPHGSASLSRRILAGIFALVAAYVLVRLLIYLYIGVSRDFTVETGDSYLNLVSAMFMTILPITGTTAFLLMCSDSLRRQLEQAASTDYLTGLPNRRSLARNGEERFAIAREHGGGFAVALLDIDSFKSINDSFGHEVGDRALVQVACLLRETARQSDMIARSGGEEFVVLMNDLDPAQAALLIERMRSAIEENHFGIGAQTIPLTISAGVAAYRTGDRSFEDILRRADQSLYMAKSQGRNRVETARPAIVQA